MATREEQKRQRREERQAREAEAAARDRRARRLRMLAIALGAAVVVVVVAIVISTSGGGSKGGKQTGAASGTAQTAQLLAGIPQSGYALGSSRAPVTIVEFADLQCPFCKEYTLNAFPTLVRKYVKTGKLRIELRNFAIVGPDSQPAARALTGAAKQNKAWSFLDLWYRNQGTENSGYVTDAFIKRIASGVNGLDPAAVVAASHDQSDPSLATANTEASKYGVNSTPSFLIGKTGGTMTKLGVSDTSSSSGFEQAIDQLLNA